MTGFEFQPTLTDIKTPVEADVIDTTPPQVAVIVDLLYRVAKEELSSEKALGAEVAKVYAARIASRFLKVAK